MNEMKARILIKMMQETEQSEFGYKVRPSEIFPGLNVIKFLRELEKDGLVESGASQLSRWQRLWHITESGIKKAKEIGGDK